MGREPMCDDGDHDFDQTGRCNDCGFDPNARGRSWGERRSGGAGSRTHPTTNREYREQMKKLARR